MQGETKKAAMNETRTEKAERLFCMLGTEEKEDTFIKILETLNFAATGCSENLVYEQKQRSVRAVEQIH
jgi:hypothetical protein